MFILGDRSMVDRSPIYTSNYSFLFNFFLYFLNYTKLIYILREKMSNARFPFSSNIPYHIHNRGWNKQRIFLQPYDYARFIKNLKLLQKDYGDELLVLAFSLLPNHFHLIIKPFESGFYVSDFMRKLQGTHAMYIKKRYGDTFPTWIPIFGQRFSSHKINNDQYLAQCFYYVHNNAVKHEYVENILDRPYTSLHYLWIPESLELSTINKKQKSRENDNWRDFFETGLG